MNKMRTLAAMGVIGFLLLNNLVSFSGVGIYGGRQIQSEVVTSTPINPLANYHNYLPLTRKPISTYYVATDGDDNNPGTITQPWRTLQHAADVALPRTIIFVRHGTYYGFTLERPDLIFSGYPGETAIVVHDLEGINTIKIRNISGAVIQNLIIQDNPVQYGTGINVEDASYVIIRGNVFQNNQGFGVVTKNVSNVTIENNELMHNGNAIEIRYGSDNVLIQDNLIHHNDRQVDSGRTSIGITFYFTTGPVIARGNSLWENHTIDLPDPAGAALEVYAASNITMTENIIWDNETALETGTDHDKTPCNNLTFTRNIVFRGSRQQGLILRCASYSLIAHNTFDGQDNFVFDLSHFDGHYGASIEGLQILNNIMVFGRVYSIENTLPDSVVIDNNLLYNPGSPSEYGEYLAYVNGHGNTNSFTEFQSWTGYEMNGINLDPLFVNLFGQDYHLTAASPAIDQGVFLGDPYWGSAPDLGAFEFIP
jgi:parallel beta-helix repeat protein